VAADDLIFDKAHLTKGKTALVGVHPFHNNAIHHISRNKRQGWSQKQDDDVSKKLSKNVLTVKACGQLGLGAVDDDEAL